MDSVVAKSYKDAYREFLLNKGVVMKNAFLLASLTFFVGVAYIPAALAQFYHPGQTNQECFSYRGKCAVVMRDHNSEEIKFYPGNFHSGCFEVLEKCRDDLRNPKNASGVSCHEVVLHDS